MYKKVSHLSTVHLQRHSFTSVAPFLIRKQTKHKEKRQRLPPNNELNKLLPQLGIKRTVLENPRSPTQKNFIMSIYPFSVSGPCGTSDVYIQKWELQSLPPSSNLRGEKLQRRTGRGRYSASLQPQPTEKSANMPPSIPIRSQCPIKTKGTTFF